MVNKENFSNMMLGSSYAVVKEFLETLAMANDTITRAANEYNSGCINARINLSATLKWATKKLLYINQIYKVQSGKSIFEIFVDTDDNILMFDLIRELHLMVQDFPYETIKSQKDDE